MLDEPREPLRGTRQLEDFQAQARPGQRSAVGAQRLAGGTSELLEHIADDTIVGGRRRPQHRDLGR